MKSTWSPGFDFFTQCKLHKHIVFLLKYSTSVGFAHKSVPMCCSSWSDLSVAHSIVNKTNNCYRLFSSNFDYNLHNEHPAVLRKT